MKIQNLLVLATTLTLVACGGEGITNSGGGATRAPDTNDNTPSRIASDCLAIVDEGQTVKPSGPVEGNHNFRITNNCSYTVNARLYSVGYVGTTVSALAAGGSAIDDFFILPGQPLGFACRAPFQPQVSLAGGLSRQCL